MSVGQLFVEQLLIGALVLLTIALPLADMWVTMLSKDTQVLVAAGSVIAGAAYLLGVVGDRVADSFFDGLEHMQRMDFAGQALKSRLSRRHPDAPCLVDVAYDRGWDLFDESGLRVAALKSKAAVVEYADYLRSRIRLARGLGAFVPGLVAAMAGTLWVSSARTGLSAESNASKVALVIAAIYALGLVFAVAGDWQRRRDESRTSNVGAVAAHARNRKLLCGCERHHHRWTSWLFWAASVPAFTGLMLTSAAVAFVWCNDRRTPMAWLLPLAGAFMGLVSGWTWWRVSWTYRQLLKSLAPVAYPLTARRPPR